MYTTSPCPTAPVGQECRHPQPDTWVSSYIYKRLGLPQAFSYSTQPTYSVIHLVNNEALAGTNGPFLITALVVPVFAVASTSSGPVAPAIATAVVTTVVAPVPSSSSAGSSH